MKHQKKSNIIKPCAELAEIISENIENLLNAEIKHNFITVEEAKAKLKEFYDGLVKAYNKRCKAHMAEDENLWFKWYSSYEAPPY